MLADGGDIGEQRVGRYPGGDGRKESDQRIERHAGRDGQQTVVQDFAIGPNEDVLPAAPGDLLRHVCPASTAGFGGAPLLQGRWLLRRRSAGRQPDGIRPGAIILELEG
jgi:hypothetical protein